jgi:hypothetical protein
VVEEGSPPVAVVDVAEVAAVVVVADPAHALATNASPRPSVWTAFNRLFLIEASERLGAFPIRLSLFAVASRR